MIVKMVLFVNEIVGCLLSSILRRCCENGDGDVYIEQAWAGLYMSIALDILPMRCPF